MSTLDQYTDSDQSDHARAKHLLAELLSDVNTRDGAIPGGDLAEYLDGNMENAPAETTVRDLLPEIRRERSLPIVAAPSGGYYTIESVDDLEDHLERIDAEIDTRLERKQELTAAFNSERVRGHE